MLAGGTNAVPVNHGIAWNANAPLGLVKLGTTGVLALAAGAATASARVVASAETTDRRIGIILVRYPFRR
jgi:hypothetical protein